MRRRVGTVPRCLRRLDGPGSEEKGHRPAVPGRPARQVQGLGLDPEKWLLGQGTIYPDTIESGGAAKKADVIKTHHNRVPEIDALIERGLVVEPLADLYKDEVRAVGERLGLAPHLVWRQPFPGPGLGVRLLCHDGRTTTPT